MPVCYKQAIRQRFNTLAELEANEDQIDVGASQKALRSVKMIASKRTIVLSERVTSHCVVPLPHRLTHASIGMVLQVLDLDPMR
jgi:hypothetical protein